MNVRGVLILVILIVLIAFGVALFSDYLSLPRFLLNGFKRAETSTTVTSSGILESIRDIARLQTVSGVYHVVFPHDFYLPDLTPSELLRKIAGGGETSLSPEETLHLEAFTLAQETGLSLSRTDHEFVVISVVVEAGYDLDAPPFRGLPPEAVFRRSSEGNGEVVQPAMYLPDAVILNIRIEDMNRENYTYPSLSLTPDEIRSISTFVRRHILTLEEVGTLTLVAREQAQEIFSRLLGASGSVNFSRNPLATDG